VNGTIVVDSSVIVAILANEPDGEALAATAAGYERRMISAATWFEAAMVCEWKKRDGGELFDEIVRALKLEIVPVTHAQAQIARAAFRRFGKGRHKARLTFGDCFSYAAAKDLGAPLLFKGNDFAQTDLERA
jgi:ribonuclease VapC